jgi:quercetin dioxygenase-like cupin family protein
MTPSVVEPSITSQAVVAPHSVVEPTLIVEQKETSQCETPQGVAPCAQPKIVHPGEGTLWHAFGDSIRALLTEDETGGQLFVGHMEPPADYGPPLHVHAQEDEIFIVEQGRFEFTVRDAVVQAGPGTVLYGPRNIPHTWRATGAGPNHATVISVPGSFGSFFERCAAAFAGGEPDMEQVMRIADEHGLFFVTPEEAALYQTQSEDTPQPKVVLPGEGALVEMPGERGRALLVSQETGAQFLLAEVEVDPGFGPPPHIHTREDELFLVQEGQFEFRIGNEYSQAGPGTVVFAPRNIPHAFRAVGEVPARAIVLVQPGGFEQFFARYAEMRCDESTQPQQIVELAAEYGIHFLPPGD